MANRIVLNTVSYHGKGAINEIPGVVKSKGFKHIFVCSDPDLVKFGVTAKVTGLLEKEGIPMAEAEITMIPQNYVSLSEEADIVNIGRILDLLEEDDDVQEVYHNWDE